MFPWWSKWCSTARRAMFESHSAPSSTLARADTMLMHLSLVQGVERASKAGHDLSTFLKKLCCLALNSCFAMTVLVPSGVIKHGLLENPPLIPYVM